MVESVCGGSTRFQPEDVRGHYSLACLGLPLLPVYSGVIKDTRRSSGDKRLNVADVVNACSVINTADYCAETAGQVCQIFFSSWVGS